MSYKRIATGPDGHPLWDWKIELSKRSLPGHIPFDFSALRKGIRRRDGWVPLIHEDYDYVIPQADGALTIESTSAADAPGGGGVEDVRVFWFDLEGKAFKNNAIELNGTTPVSVGTGTGANFIGIANLDNNISPKTFQYLPQATGDLILRHPDGIVGVFRKGQGIYTDGFRRPWLNTRSYPITGLFGARGGGPWEFKIGFIDFDDLNEPPRINEVIGVDLGQTVEIDLRHIGFAGAPSLYYIIYARNLSPQPGEAFATINGVEVDQRCLTPAVPGTGIAFN